MCTPTNDLLIAGYDEDFVSDVRPREWPRWRLRSMRHKEKGGEGSARDKSHPRRSAAHGRQSCLLQACGPKPSRSRRGAGLSPFMAKISGDSSGSSGHVHLLPVRPGTASPPSASMISRRWAGHFLAGPARVTRLSSLSCTPPMRTPTAGLRPGSFCAVECDVGLGQSQLHGSRRGAGGSLPLRVSSVPRCRRESLSQLSPRSSLRGSKARETADSSHRIPSLETPMRRATASAPADRSHASPGPRFSASERGGPRAFGPAVHRHPGQRWANGNERPAFFAVTDWELGRGT